MTENAWQLRIGLSPEALRDGVFELDDEIRAQARHQLYAQQVVIQRVRVLPSESNVILIEAYGTAT